MTTPGSPESTSSTEATRLLRTRLLRLRVISGHNLAKKDIFGASDPYVQVQLMDLYLKKCVYTTTTKIIKKTLNPQWNQEFIFRVVPAKQKLVLEVFDMNRITRDDFLGLVEINLNDVITEASDDERLTDIDKFYVLRPRSLKSNVRGHIKLYCAYLHSPDQDSGISDSPASQEPSPTTVANTLNDLTIEDLSPQGQSEASESPSALDATRTEYLSLPNLPEGWEERQDANGRTYYINHSSRISHWHHPGLAPGEDPDFESQLLQHQVRHHISLDESTSVVGSRSQSRATSPHRSPSGEPTQGTAFPRLLDANLPPIVSVDETDNPEPNDIFVDLLVDAVSREFENEVDGLRDTSLSASASASAPASPSPSSTTLRTPSPFRPPAPSDGLPEGWAMQAAPNGRMFFINHKQKKTTWIDPRTNQPSPMPTSSADDAGDADDDVVDLEPLPEGWEERLHSDGRTFFIDHNSKITQWEDPRLSIARIAGPAVPYNRNYKQKYDYFKRQLKKVPVPSGKFEMKVRRKFVLEDSFKAFNHTKFKADNLKSKLWITFDGEVGLDYGGLAREWFYLISKEMFNPYYGLFEYSAVDNYTLQINPSSGLCHEEHLSYFRFVGRVAGMAVFHGKLLDGFFIRPFYKMMLGKEISLDDMEAVDAEYYNSLQWIRDNDPVDLELTFQVDEELMGSKTSRNLIPNGDRISVTNSNKELYIRHMIKWRFMSRVKEQMEKFLRGFEDVMPLNLLKIFDEGELELLMCGIGNIDVKDWRDHTAYKGDYSPNHVVIQYFWRAVLSFSNEKRSRLLQFATGTSRVPMNGFKELQGSNGPQKFTIEKWGSSNSLPRAHTCFNRLDLPPYESFQQLRSRLVMAIEGSEGFEGVD